MSKKIFQTLSVGCCTHGNEQVGLALAQKYLKGQTEFFDYQTIICNPKAVEINKRFVEQDLNRSFPGIKNGNYEQNRAFEITKLLDKSDFIIDIHQTTAQNNSCIIVNRLSKLNQKMLGFINLENVIIDNVEDGEFEFSKATNEVGGMCLDGVFPLKSMTLEYSRCQSQELEFDILENDFENLINQAQIYNNKKYYTFIGTLNKKNCFNIGEFYNFVKLTLAQKTLYNLEINQEIYPCFIGEQSYDEIYCFWVKRLVINQN
jgi:succinylglutamate desuccinylase